MHITFALITLLSLSSFASAAIVPRAPKGGGGGGGGGRGGGGGGRRGGSGGGSSSGSIRTSGTGTGRGGSGDTGRPAIFYGSGLATPNRNANYFSSGGGRPFTLSDSSIFRGRQMGGGVRTQVTGTRSFGSGYPYSVGDVKRTGVAGQPFPFGFWPLYWGGRGHSGEYGVNRTVAAQRPGGDQVLIQLIPNVTASTWNTTANETYWMIGDTESATTLLSILVDRNTTTSTWGCGVQNLTIQSFNSSDSLHPVQFENVVQWYRSSSFALAYPGYNNSYALAPLNETFGLGWNDSTPLPTQLQYSPFLQCINATISAALPILDPEPAPEPPLSPAAIAGIVIGSIFGSLFFCCCAPFCLRAIKDGYRAGRARAKQTVKEKEMAKNQPEFIVTESQSNYANSFKAPPSPWLHPYSPESLSPPFESYPQRSSMTFPEPAFINWGRESFYSSRTLIVDAHNHERGLKFNSNYK